RFLIDLGHLAAGLRHRPPDILVGGRRTLQPVGEPGGNGFHPLGCALAKHPDADDRGDTTDEAYRRKKQYDCSSQATHEPHRALLARQRASSPRGLSDTPLKGANDSRPTLAAPAPVRPGPSPRQSTPGADSDHSSSGTPVGSRPVGPGLSCCTPADTYTFPRRA